MRPESSTPCVRLLSSGQPLRWLGVPLHRLAALVVLLLLVSGAVYFARGATQSCKDFDNVTICYDNETDLAPLLQEAVFRYDGNVTIARKGQAPLLKLVASPAASAATVLHVVDGSVEGGPIVRFPLSIFGALQFINEPNAQPLISTIKTDISNCGGQFATIEGKFKINTVDATIVLPTTDDIVSTNDLDQCNGVRSLANAFRFDYLDRNGITQLFEANETSAVNLTGGIYKWDLTARNFTSAFNANVKLNDASENPNLQIRIRTTIDELGKLTGGIDAFKVKIAGLLMAATNVTMQLGVGGQSATFKAGKVTVAKVDNPDQPSFNPLDSTLIFEFTNLKYSQGKWEIDGVEVAMPNLALGTAFSMEQNKIGILSETSNGQTVQSIQIKSNLVFNEGNGVPIVLRIGRAQDGNGQFKPVFQAGLQDQKIKLGTLAFNLKNVTFVGNTAENFWGLKADSAAVQWPPHLGGQTAAAVANFKIGINRDLKMQFALGNGTVGLPPFENNVFKGVLQASIGVVAETVTITGTGTFTIKLAGNANSAGVAVTAILRHNRNINATVAQVQSANEIAAQLTASGVNAARICFGPGGRRIACPGEPPLPETIAPKAFELKLAGFNLKLAGFGLNVLNPRSTDDGGFAADDVGFSLPFGLSTDGSSANAQIQGLVVTGDGNVSISGGGIGLPSLKIGNLKIAGLKGSFLKEANGNYAFAGGAKLPLPGIENIGVEVTIRSDGNGSFAGAGVKVEINLPTTAGIPVGPSGMLLTGMRGTFDINNSTTTFGLGVTFRSVATLPLGPLGQLSLVKVDGDITVQFNPFKFIGNTDLSVLIFELASASIRFGDGEGFDGRSGINVEVIVNKVIMKGVFKLRYSKGTASDPNKRRFAASATWTFGIKKGDFGTAIPPFNLGGIDAQLAGGIFTDKNNNPATETSGIRASICGPNGNLCIGMFVNLAENVGSGDFVDFTNIDKYALIPAAAVRAAAARGEVGFASRRLTPDEVNQLGLVVAADALAAGIFEEIVDIPITQTTTLLAGIDYFTGTPLVRLQLPDGTILTESTVNGTNQTVLAETQAITKSIYFVVSGATPGTYKLLIDNATDYEKVSYTLNTAPQLTIGDVTCPSSNPPTPVNTVCLIGLNASADPSVAASAVEQINASSATITWTGSDIDSPGATVNIGYIKDSGDKDNIDYSAINFVAEGLPLSAGSHAINFKESGTGAYRLVVIADDGINGLVYLASSTVISVTDKLAPAVPSGLQAVSQAGEMLVKWTQNSEADLAGYEIGFGLVNDPNQFIYSRNMGPKEVMTGTNNIVDAKIWGLQDNVTIFYGLRAYDGSGNFSDWTPLQSATPWAVSPNTWTPIPGGAGTTLVEIGFAVPMKLETLETALTVKDSAGNVIPGTTYLLVDFDGTKTVGVGFVPNSPLKGAFTATLKGGAGGAQAADGRTMGADYTWSFTLKPTEVFMPLVAR